MKTIFDIGMHRGDDAAFYLAKGFKVVSVEPFPEYINAARDRFSDYIGRDHLRLVQKAVTEPGGGTITFFVNKNKDDSHTTRGDLVQQNLASGIFAYDELAVETASLASLFDEHGLPYYMKCDIEGADEQVLDQLVRDHRRPDFISFEISSRDIIEKMKVAGYQSFQLVNQWLNPTLSQPDPPREGVRVEMQFNGHMSGLFGRELPAAKWMSVEKVLRLYDIWIEIQQIDPAFAVGGWADCHASMLSPEQLLS